MKIELSLKLNDEIRVYLTEYGYSVYEKYELEQKGKLLPYTCGGFNFKLYKLFEIFGEDMKKSNRHYTDYFVNSEIILECNVK
jgi:hypothetical protein